MTSLRHTNNSKLGLVNGAIGTVNSKGTEDPEFDLDEEVIEN